jgi:hypothetical protein
MTLRQHIHRALITQPVTHWPDKLFHTRANREQQMRDWLMTLPVTTALRQLPRLSQCAGFYSQTTTDFILLFRLAHELNFQKSEAL